MRLRGFSAIVAFSLGLSSLIVTGVMPAYAGTVYSFTTAGASGASGPTQSQVNAAYSGTSLAGLVTINTQGIQEWVVPTTGDYWIELAGASGGYTPNALGGKGRKIKIRVSLTAGHRLKILVGQEGGRIYFASGSAAGGGGGTYIYNATTSSFVAVAGGGGGAAEGGGGYSSIQPGVDAAAYNSTSGTAGTSYSGSWQVGQAGGTGGSAGVASSGGGSGAGINGNGAKGSYGGNGGTSFANGGTGGAHYAGTTATTNVAGGFGGGAGGGILASYEADSGGGGGYSGGGGGGTRIGAGGGGGNFYTGTYVSNSLNTGNGIVTIEAVGPSLSNFAPRTVITNQASIIYDIEFSEAVTGLASGDFSLTGTGSSTCTIGTPSGSGTTYSIALSGCSPGTVILTMAANVVSNASSQTAPDSNTNAAIVTIDQTAPTISTVTAPANKTYISSETPTFTVAFSESVTITGNPRLTLTVGSSTEYANFVSLTDSRTALFRYTVASDPLEFDTDGITMSNSLDLNSGTIRDLATNSLSNLTFTAPTLTSVLVAQPAAAPTIDSITATSGQLAIYFTPGAARGSTTTTYQYSSNGGAWTNRPTGTTASPLTITGLTNGTGYTIRLRATTNAGAGDSSTAVTETPTSITVTGDSTLVLTYGNSASTSAYSASGGTNSFTWSLGSSLTGISLSGSTVTAGATTPAGIYTQTVRATDTNSQVGSKTLIITVNKASTSITISLPNSSSNAALGGAVTITATVPRAGAVNFMLGGSTISGCGSASAASTTATCSWTPAALGSVSLTAVFTPTDSSNYETSTTTTLSITVVNGVSTVTLSLTGGTTTPPKGQAINIIAAVDQAGRITFLVDGKRIAGCYNKVATVGNVTCSWKPAVQKQSTITARLVPSNSVYNLSTSSLNVQVVRRIGTR